MSPARRGSHAASPHAPARGPGAGGAGSAGSADDATTTTTHAAEAGSFGIPPLSSYSGQRLRGGRRTQTPSQWRFQLFRTDSATRGPTNSRAGPPAITARAISSRAARGAVANQLSHIWPPTCRTWDRSCARRPSNPRAGSSIRTSTLQSARGPANTSLGRPAHTPDSGFTCDIAGYRSQ